MFLHLAVNECKRQVEWTAVLKIRPSLLFNLDGLSVGSEDSRLVCLLLHPLQGALHKLFSNWGFFWDALPRIVTYPLFMGMCHSNLAVWILDSMRAALKSRLL